MLYPASGCRLSRCHIALEPTKDGVRLQKHTGKKIKICATTAKESVFCHQCFYPLKQIHIIKSVIKHSYLL